MRHFVAPLGLEPDRAEKNARGAFLAKVPDCRVRRALSQNKKVLQLQDWFVAPLGLEPRLS